MFPVSKTNHLKQWSHNTCPRFGQNLYACAQLITRGVAAIDSCFGLVGPQQHGGGGQGGGRPGE